MDQQGSSPRKTYLVAASSERHEVGINAARTHEAGPEKDRIEIRHWNISSGGLAILPFAKRSRQMWRCGRWGTAGPL
jgi:hypothetical protein